MRQDIRNRFRLLVLRVWEAACKDFDMPIKDVDAIIDKWAAENGFSDEPNPTPTTPPP